MKWNELKKIAESYGWRLKRQGANHEVYYHPDKDYQIEISRHGKEEIKKRYFSQIEKTDRFLKI